MKTKRRLRFLIVRLGFLVIVVWGAVTLVFLVGRVLPGDPALLLSGPTPDSATVSDTRIRLGLDKSIPAQYVLFLQGTLQGDLGVSYTTGRPVGDDVAERIPATLELIIFAFTIAVVASLILASLAAISRVHGRGKVDAVIRPMTLLGVAIPTFWLGLLLLLLFWQEAGIAPAPTGRLGGNYEPPSSITGFYTIDFLLSGDFPGFLDASGHLALPGLALAIPVGAALTRVLRAKMVDVMRSDYYLTARALGIPLRRRIVSDALRTAIIPVLPFAASLFGFLVGGAVFVERIYGWPGIGQYGLNGITNSDYPAMAGFVLVAVIIYALAFLVSDLISMWLDPRIV